MKILTVLGARPQFIKSGVVSREIAASKCLDEVLLHTGQHFDANMSTVFFDEMDLKKPDHHLDISGLPHGAMTGRMMEGIESYAMQIKPDAILVYGDTNSTLAGGLVGAKLNLKVFHIEAGLRSFNLRMPEEINRIVTDRLSDVLFCPSQAAIDNLKREGFDSLNKSIINSGDVMFDSAVYFKSKAKFPESLPFSENSGSRFVLATLHRAENVDSVDTLKKCIASLNLVNQQCEVILPVHPRTKQKIVEAGLIPEFKMIAPVGYLNMLWMLSNCDLVITDSGGLQKEAYFFKKKCISMRNETEWTELSEAGCLDVIGTDPDRVLDAYMKGSCEEFSTDPHIYGDGSAALKIVKALESLY